MDPRTVVIPKRLEPVQRIVAVGGGKGGVGKSTVAALSALALAGRGTRVGLLDLDFTGPSAHVILGLTAKLPSESFGIDPALEHGVQWLSVAQFLRDQPVALRGSDFSEAFLEILAITRWPTLDVLLIDMPPGIQDATLDLLRYLRRAEFLVVTTPSRVAQQTVARAVKFLRQHEVPMLGAVVNLSGLDASLAEAEPPELGIPALGHLPADPLLEAAIGLPELLERTAIFRAIRERLCPILSTTDSSSTTA